MTKYSTIIRQNADMGFIAGVLYEDRPVPGLPFKTYATRKAAERGAAIMLKKAA